MCAGSRLFTSARIRTICAGSSPLAGSSSTSTGGLCRSACAKFTRSKKPLESERSRVCRTSASEHCAMTRSTARAAAVRPPPASAPRAGGFAPATPLAPVAHASDGSKKSRERSVRYSATVYSLGAATTSLTKPVSRRTRSASSRASTPATRTAPAVAKCRAQTALSTVVFPAPFKPSKPVTVPRLHRMENPCTAAASFAP